MGEAHYVFAIHFTKRQSRGTWHAEDDYEHQGWSEPQPFTEYYVASKEEIALAHFNYWKPHRCTDENPIEITKVETLGQAKIILELRP